MLFRSFKALSQVESVCFDATRLGIAPIRGLILSSSVHQLALTKTRFDTMLDYHRFVTAFPSLRILRLGSGVHWDIDGEISLVQRRTLKLDHLCLTIGGFPECDLVAKWFALLRSIKLERFEFIPKNNDFTEVEETWEPVWDRLLSKTTALRCNMRPCRGQSRTSVLAP